MTDKHPSARTLALFHEHGLTPAREVKIREHLARCGECQSRLTELRENSRFLTGLGSELSPRISGFPEAIDEVVLRRLTSELPPEESLAAESYFVPGIRSSHPDAPLIPDYVLSEMIGEGSFGTVWRGEDLFGNPCAIKVLPKHGKQKAGEYELNGIRQAMRIRHPNLVEIRHVGQLQRDWYYVMELVPVTLEAQIEGGQSLAPELCLEVLRALLQVLRFCHEHGIAHRDIKPANIGFTAEGSLKLLDLGLVTAANRSNRTALGTPDYMPAKPFETPALDDLYAAGILLHRLLNGCVPGGSGELPPNPGASALFSRLNQVAARARGRSLESPFTSAAEFLDHLEAVSRPAAGEINSAAGERFRKPRRKYTAKTNSTFQIMNVNQIQNTARFLETNGFALSERLRRELQNLDNPSYKIAFVGRFQVGKSTLINRAFLKQEILLKEGPNIPTTAVATEVTYGQAPRLSVYPWLTRTEEVTVGENSQTCQVKVGVGEPAITENPTTENIGTVTTAEGEDRRLNLANRIASVKLEWPIESLRNYVIYDTPGIDDANTLLLDATTYRIIPQVDTAILVVEAKQLTEIELAFLRSRLFETGLSRIMILVSFNASTTKLSAQSRGAILTAIRGQLAAIGREHIPVAMFCHDAQVDGEILNTPEAIENSILSFLTENAGLSRINKAAFVLYQEVKNALLAVAAKLATADKTETELEGLKSKLASMETELADKYDTMKVRLTIEIKALQGEVNRAFATGCDAEAKKFLDGFDGCTGITAVRDRLDQSNVLLKPALESLASDLAASAASKFASIVERYDRELAKATEALCQSMPIDLQINPGWFGRLNPMMVTIGDYALVVFGGPFRWGAAIAFRFLADKIPVLKNLLPANFIGNLVVSNIKKSLAGNIQEIKANMESRLEQAFAEVTERVKAEFSKIYMNQVAPISKAVEDAIQSPRRLSDADKQRLKMVRVELEKFGAEMA